jgi:hypothetical protein
VVYTHQPMRVIPQHPLPGLLVEINNHNCLLILAPLTMCSRQPDVREWRGFL